MSVPDNSMPQTLTQLVLNPGHSLLNAPYQLFLSEGNMDTQHFLWQLHLNLIMHPNTSVNIAKKYLLEGL